MAELRLLNVDPGAQLPVVGSSPSVQGMNLTPDCPDCGANRYMHESPDMHTTNLRCLECGAVHQIVGTTTVNAQAGKTREDIQRENATEDDAA